MMDYKSRNSNQDGLASETTPSPAKDPLQLRAQEPANVIRVARAAPHPDIERIFARLTGPHFADSQDVRLLLLAHMLYVAYRDIKEQIAL